MAKSYEVEVKFPELPMGEELDFPTLGTVLRNGSKTTLQLSDEQADILRDTYGISIKSAKASEKEVKT